jgi:hypothetical protein
MKKNKKISIFFLFYLFIKFKNLLFSTKHLVPNVYAGAFFSRHDLRGKTYEHGDGLPSSSTYCTIKLPVIGCIHEGFSLVN